MRTFVGVIPKDEAVGALWPQIADLLACSLPHGRGEYTLDDIKSGIADQSLFAVASVDDGIVQFVAVCAVCQYPRKRVLYIQHGAGRNGTRLIDIVTHAARTLECDWIETRCRTAVSRLYRRLGFDCHYVTPILETPQ